MPAVAGSRAAADVELLAAVTRCSLTAVGFNDAGCRSERLGRASGGRGGQVVFEGRITSQLEFRITN